MFRAIEYYARRAFYALLSGPRAIVRLLLAPFRWIGRLLAQIAAWWSRRESRYLLRGLPALVTFVGAAFLLVACRMRSDAVLAEKYLSAARLSEASKPAVAAMFLERVVQLRPADNETLFELASMAQQAGDQARTAVLMRQLAPDPREGPGYWRAHLEMGKSYLKIQRLSTANFLQAKMHFEQALEQDHDNADAYAYLGQLYFVRGVMDQAIENFSLALEHGKDERGELRSDLQIVMLLLAKAYTLRNNPEDDDDAEQLALRARDLYAARVARRPKEDAQSRIVLADAEMFLEHFEAASKVLSDGLLLNDDKEDQGSLRTALAQLNVAWSVALERQGSPDETRARRFELLSSALLYDPNFFPIFDKMMGILSERTETATTAREFLLANVAAGRSIEISHLLLGSAAFEANDPTAAAYHLERAYELRPNALVVVNNLAWFLAFKDPPDLDRALSLINNVLKRAPNDARFLDTRGQIYTKLERWDDAMADLERALQQGLPDAETHDALAVCYGAKGLPELEHLHRQSAEAARAKQH